MSNSSPIASTIIIGQFSFVSKKEDNLLTERKQIYDTLHW